MVRGLRRSYSCVVCFLCMPSAMMVTGVSVHTSVAQLVSTSSSVSSSRSVFQRLWTGQPRSTIAAGKETTSGFLYWPKCPPLEAQWCQSQGHVWKSRPFWLVSDCDNSKSYTGIKDCTRRREMTEVLSCRNFLSTWFACSSTPGLEDGLTCTISTRHLLRVGH